MIRKHTRRAAKAAFAISMGVAIVIGLFAGTASPAPNRGRADDRDRHEELRRGVHPRRALQAGARGEGLHRHEQGEHRLDRDDPDRAHERQDQLLPRVHGRDRPGRVPQDVLGETAAATTGSRRSSRRPRASRPSTPTPFYDTDVLAVTNATAKKYGLKSIGDLKKVGAFKLAGFPECQTRNTCFVGYTKQYGLRTRRSSRSRRSPPTSRSTRGRCSRPTSSRPIRRSARPSKYTVLADPKHVTGFQNVAPIVKSGVADGGRPELHEARSTPSRRSSPTPAIIAMNKAFYVDKQSAASIAKTFLQANGLL